MRYLQHSVSVFMLKRVYLHKCFSPTENSQWDITSMAGDTGTMEKTECSWEIRTLLSSAGKDSMRIKERM